MPSRGRSRRKAKLDQLAEDNQWQETPSTEDLKAAFDAFAHKFLRVCEVVDHAPGHTPVRALQFTDVSALFRVLFPQFTDTVLDPTLGRLVRTRFPDLIQTHSKRYLNLTYTVEGWSALDNLGLLWAPVTTRRPRRKNVEGEQVVRSVVDLVLNCDDDEEEEDASVSTDCSVNSDDISDACSVDSNTDTVTNGKSTAGSRWSSPWASPTKQQIGDAVDMANPEFLEKSVGSDDLMRSVVDLVLDEQCNNTTNVTGTTGNGSFTAPAPAAWSFMSGCNSFGMTAH